MESFGLNPTSIGIIISVMEFFLSYIIQISGIPTIAFLKTKTIFPLHFGCFKLLQ